MKVRTATIGLFLASLALATAPARAVELGEIPRLNGAGFISPVAPIVPTNAMSLSAAPLAAPAPLPGAAILTANPAASAVLTEAPAVAAAASPATAVAAPAKAPPQDVDLDQLEYEQARNVVGILLKEHAPSGHYFLGVGRSPAIVTAVLKNLDSELAGTLPLSDFYHHPEGRSPYYVPLTEDVEARLFDHFERFIPADVLRGERGLVLVDYVKGGRSMIALDEYLKVFARKRHPGLKWDFAGIAEDTEPHPGFVESGRSYRLILPSEVASPGTGAIMHMRMAYMWNKEESSEYDSFPAPFEGSASLKSRAEFAAWRARLAKRMAGDAALRELRAGVFPGEPAAAVP